jgi:hypothetical protein
MKTLWRVRVPDSIRDLMNELERRQGSFYLRLLPYHYRPDNGGLNEELVDMSIREGVETLGVLLSPKEHEQLIEWWKEAMAVRKRGNPGKAPQKETVGGICRSVFARKRGIHTPHWQAARGQ